MPTYEYYSEETGETKEVFHGMFEEPEILDSEGNVMKKAVSGGTGFIFTGKGTMSGGTRRNTMRQRHGHKKTDSQLTPSESAQKKAQALVKQKELDKKNKQDPYHAWR